MTTDTLSPVEASWHALLSQLPTCGLTALRDALERDDPAIVQGATVQPCAVGAAGDFPPQAACAYAYGAWKAWRLATAHAVDAEFARLCVKADLEAGGEAAFCRHALNHYDESPRAVAFALVLKVAVAVLAQRAKEVA
jgi:hypothetical protein